MCGFAGVIAFNQKYAASAETLAAMAGEVAHRGPDGRGTHFDPAGVALAHVRLAILDPDPRSDQPFSLNGKWLVYNGEIYNFRELRQELSKLRPDYAWRTSGDTEVLLLAIDTWGEGALAKLNGMFAFAVWDERDRSLLLARDRMGQKPLYFAVAPENGAVAFASELGALRHVQWMDRELDAGALTHYLSWGYIPAPLTIYRGAQKLRQSAWLRFSAGGAPQSGRYYDVSTARPVQREQTPWRETRQIVIEAVRRQLVSDVPLGCFLSGGIDSSIIAAAMKASVAPGQRVVTFSIGFDDPRYDETPCAREVAEHLGTEHFEFRVMPHAAEDLPKLARVYGEPFGDSSALPTHYLAWETRRHVKVALSGDGGDELFGGYDRYRAMRLAEKIEGFPGVVRNVFDPALWEGVGSTHPKSAGAKWRRFVDAVGLSAAERYAAYMRLFDADAVLALYPAADAAALQWLPRVFGQLQPGRDEVEAALATDRETYLPEDLLTKVDRASMLHALEVRSPFMDPDVLALAGSLTTRDLLEGGGKRMLREAFANDLPRDVFRRKKMGFAVPIGQWFRGRLRGMLWDTLLSADSFCRTHFDGRELHRLLEQHESQSADHSQRLYALLMLELWHRRG